MKSTRSLLRMVLAFSLAAAACGPAASEGAPATPEPAGGKDPSAPAPETPRRSSSSALLYAPTASTAYAYRRRDSLILEFPGATQVQTLDRTAYLRVAIADEAESYRATIVLDSLRAPPGAPVSEDSLRQADGTRWTAALAPTGQLSELTASRATAVGEQIGSTLQALFPALPSSGASAGSEWVDTSRTTIRTVAFEAEETAVTSYRAENAESREGRQALKVETEGVFQRVGSGLQFGQEMDMTATGRRRGVHHVGLVGMLVTAESSDSSDMTITVPAVGQSVPVKQFSTYTITSASSASR